MLNLITATVTEANALIAAYKLKHVAGVFPLYQNDNVSLVVSGIGKSKAAAACAWLYARTENTDRHSARHVTNCWLNIGIAGHETAPIGSLFSAHKVIDHGSDKVWFPPRIASPIPSENLTTVDKPLNQYLPDQLHDMEGSGFIETARMFAHAELVQCVKVVSDNEEKPFGNITTQFAQELIENNIKPIVNFADHLLTLADTVTAPDILIIDSILQRWKFTQSQTVMLERLLQRYGILLSPMTEIPEELTQKTKSKEVLQWLTQTVENANHTI